MAFFKRVNIVAGWLVFSIATLLYILTLEPSVSLWDCGEFLSASYKLEVGHPPGAPLYLMLARLFALLSPDKAHVAFFINSLSALASAFTVLFLFWIITHLTKKIVFKTEKDYTLLNTVVVIGSGCIGALAFCFSDSFWFSAVEAEVYALSSLFTAIVFWGILKWEEDKGPYRDRWLILIVYLLGLSIGAHLLNLLAFPAVVMIYYYNKFQPSWKRTLVALLISFLLLLLILYLIIPGVVYLSSVIEVLTVNKFNLPVNSGVILFIAFLALFLGWITWFTHVKKKVMWNTFFLCMSAIMIGYSSYSMILIRAHVNPPINTNDPDNIFSLGYYLNRDQYGNRPLLYGPLYNTPVKKVSTGKGRYVLVDGKYQIEPGKKAYVYDERFLTFFPRIYSNNPNHVEVYKGWGTIKGKPVTVVDQNGKEEIVYKPTFIDNLEFFVKYQVGYMYLRYFMWSFAGKQNDQQGNGGILKGNWISGFDFIDKWMIGSQNALPEHMKKNPGRNRYFLLPLLLGLAGLYFHYLNSRKYFNVLLYLFFLTGLAIVIYTNQTPLQPRERDYVYVGSFFVFSIWIGLGTLWLTNILRSKLNIVKAVIIGLIIAALIPMLMLFQNFDDHNRSGRYLTRDIAYNYLNTCEPNAILFTAGDNDTYPLWYLQEVEGVRTDVRVVNLMLLNADWYIEQLKHKYYDSAPFKLKYVKSLSKSFVYLSDNYTDTLNSNEALGVIYSDLTSVRLTPNIKIPVRWTANQCVGLEYKSSEKSIKIRLSEPYIMRNEVIVLDLLSNNLWERPVYFSSPSAKGSLGLRNYLIPDGFGYRLIPVYTESQNSVLNTGKLYKKLMVDSKWSGIGDIMIDDHIRTMMSIMRVRQSYARLATALAEEGKLSTGIEVLDKLMLIMPIEKIPYDVYCLDIAKAYYKCGSKDKGASVKNGYLRQLEAEIEYYNHLPVWMKGWVSTEKSNALFYRNELLKLDI